MTLFIAGDGIFIEKGTAQTFRNLTASSKIINELLSKTLANKVKLERYRQVLQTFHFQLDSLVSDRSLFIFPKDSVQLKKYVDQLKIVAYQTNPVDHFNKTSSR